jgi:hypothetical protein
MTHPQIRISGRTDVNVEQIQSFEGLMALTGNFARLQQADPIATALNLAVNAGDLIASARGDFGNEDLADEVADMVISSLVLATLRGLTTAEVLEALRRRFEAQATDAVGTLIQEAMVTAGCGAFNSFTTPN